MHDVDMLAVFELGLAALRPVVRGKLRISWPELSRSLTRNYHSRLRPTVSQILTEHDYYINNHHRNEIRPDGVVGLLVLDVLCHLEINVLEGDAHVGLPASALHPDGVIADPWLDP